MQHKEAFGARGEGRAVPGVKDVAVLREPREGLRPPTGHFQAFRLRLTRHKVLKKAFSPSLLSGADASVGFMFSLKEETYSVVL